ncbi:MAG: hypothetical protein JRF37_07485 [Deltaproteobacteria bacterium]|nr:hypothetical protein [Deltaproteobacteria bacterium]
MEHLFTAQIVLGVLTANNPNVFYELGIAHATEPIERQVLIAEKGYKSLFDTKDLIYYEYDSDNLSESVDDLSKKVVNALDLYKIEKEKVILQARRKIGPYDFEVIMMLGIDTHFAVRSNDLKWRTVYEKQYGSGAFERHVQGITNLCSYGLLGLNTKSVPQKGGVQVEFAYWWTGLGNDILHLFKIIDEKELNKRREKLPLFFES